jgi:hypothetical protein
MNYPGGVRELETILVLDEVLEREFVCFICQRSMKAQKTLLKLDRIAGKERRSGAYCVKCAYSTMGEKVKDLSGGPEMAEAIKSLATVAALVDGDVYVIPDMDP